MICLDIIFLCNVIALRLPEAKASENALDSTAQQGRGAVSRWTVGAGGKLKDRDTPLFLCFLISVSFMCMCLHMFVVI